jgi:hypothetical protein
VINVDVIWVLFLFVIGMIIGVIPPYLWGKNGGDEGLLTDNKHIKSFLKSIHHWHIGLVMIFCCFISYMCMYPTSIHAFFLGWGITTFLDDALFHSYSNYFKRKECEGYEEH